MTIYPIGNGAFLLYAAAAELQECGLSPYSLTHEQTERLAEEGLSTLGRSGDRLWELESYPGDDGLLLFIHTEPAVWRFFDSDALLDAAAARPDLTGQLLYHWQDAFWLVGQDAALLSEFADPIPDDPLLVARLAEYAQPIP